MGGSLGGRTELRGAGASHYELAVPPAIRRRLYHCVWRRKSPFCGQSGESGPCLVCVMNMLRSGLSCRPDGGSAAASRAAVTADSVGHGNHIKHRTPPRFKRIVFARTPHERTPPVRRKSAARCRREMTPVEAAAAAACVVYTQLSAAPTAAGRQSVPMAGAAGGGAAGAVYTAAVRHPSARVGHALATSR